MLRITFLALLSVMFISGVAYSCVLPAGNVDCEGQRVPLYPKCVECLEKLPAQCHLSADDKMTLAQLMADGFNVLDNRGGTATVSSSLLSTVLVKGAWIGTKHTFIYHLTASPAFWLLLLILTAAAAWGRRKTRARWALLVCALVAAAVWAFTLLMFSTNGC